MKVITEQQEQKVIKLYNQLSSAPAIAKRIKLSVSQVYDTLRRFNVARRKSSLQNQIRFINSPLSFEFRERLVRKERELLIAAIMLYYGEGAKTGTTIDFANSDPRALKLFLKFLRQVCRVDESKLRLYLYCFSDQNVEQLIKFWSKELRVSRKNFTKPYIRAVRGQRKRIMSYGVLHVRYSDKRLLEKILNLCSEFIISLAS